MTTWRDVIAGTARWSCESGAALPWLRSLPDGAVNCVVTSPPYYGLRDYGTATWEGGDPACQHRRGRQTGRITAKTKFYNAAANVAHWPVCRRCGAVRKDEQIGLEDTPDQFVARLVEVFDEVRRVLTTDGTVWVNIGDSYANDTKGRAGAEKATCEGRPDLPSVQKGWRATGLKKKDRIGIPHMLAFALRAAGWWWRDEIIWHKPNPMTKSVKDRTTDAHEFLFLFAKSPRYHYDRDAVLEQAAYAGRRRGGSKRRYEQNGAGCDAKVYDTRNPRSVWKITPDRRRYSGVKHFAAMPAKLVRPCILAGCPAGGVVLDPFAGSGTTLAVAVELGRRAVGVDLNPAYPELVRQRVTAVTPTLIGA